MSRRRSPDRHLRDQGAERGRARTSRKDQGRRLVSLQLFAHPFSSYCQKVLIALYADGTPFEYRLLEQDHPENFEELQAPLAVRQVPDAARRRRAGHRDDSDHRISRRASSRRRTAGFRTARWSRRVRFLDRFFDLYVMDNMQKVVDRSASAGRQPRPLRRGEGAREPATSPTTGSKASSATPWAVGEQFTLADCAAAPSLFYADWVEPIGDQRPQLAAYRARLLAHPAVARAVDEGRPYRALFPARRARPRLSESGGLPQQLIGFDHRAEARLVRAVAAVLVGVIAAHQLRIASGAARGGRRPRRGRAPTAPAARPC